MIATVIMRAGVLACRTRTSAIAAYPRVCGLLIDITFYLLPCELSPASVDSIYTSSVDYLNVDILFSRGSARRPGQRACCVFETLHPQPRD